jgi:hypothetical protein
MGLPFCELLIAAKRELLIFSNRYPENLSAHQKKEKVSLDFPYIEIVMLNSKSVGEVYNIFVVGRNLRNNPRMNLNKTS